MTPTTQQALPPTTARQRRRTMVALLVALFLAGAAISYVGIQYLPPATDTSGLSQAVTRPELLVQVDLPHEEFAIPPGPYREQFQVHCTICHSPRLAFTQPLLPEKKWQEVVQKMVTVYGALPTPEEAREIVHYLTVVHGQTPP